MKKKVLVCGAGGFVGGHLASRLRSDGLFVRGVDLKHHEYAPPDQLDEFVIADLRVADECVRITEGIDEVYQLAADMGGAGYLFTGEHDADVMRNSSLINLNMAEACRVNRVARVFYSSSACVYPAHNQSDRENPVCTESSAYPADPDSEYGWEKLFSERLYQSYARNYAMEVRIARFHNVFGPLGTFRGGREKAPAALCRKVAEARDGDEIEVWGDGEQTRSFLFVDECVEGVARLMRSSFAGPVNIGSAEMVSINQLASMIMDIAGKRLTLRHVPGPQGVRGRTSDNRLIREKLGWAPSGSLREGLRKTYQWIVSQTTSSGQL
ncbi:MAG: NAD-dependent epimerase/dehydratase family protein [Deltaproteobacteria bacterium]|nr:NAD-dependent epimerase/dehydratase family protein [Deltaproteobacteria bacterium]